MTAGTASSAGTTPSQLLRGDLVHVATAGLRTRRLRAALSALGVAIGIASVVAVLGISDSSKAELVSALDRLGTNLLVVTPGETLLGEEATLPKEADEMIGRVGPVERVSNVGTVEDATVRRTEWVPDYETGGIGVKASDSSLLETLGGRLRAGRFLDGASGRYPAVVLGTVAAERLGITRLEGDPTVWIGGRRFTVVGILETLELAPELDTAAFVGFSAAARYLDDDGLSSAVYLRTSPETIDDVRGVLARTANPEAPEEVGVSRPSDALAARAAAKSAFTELFLGLGAVALLVGGVGIANIMVISVLERRSEIGLRRAIGATKRHIAVQFLTESLLLAALGGLAGVVVGAAVVFGYAESRGWDTVLSPVVVAGGLAAALAIGAAAGIYPAARAARLSPTEALRTV